MRQLRAANDTSPNCFCLDVEGRTIGAQAAMAESQITLSERSRFRVAMALAIATDALQIIVFPLFGDGALSPADDVLDFGVAAALIGLVGWHWEFLPSFVGELLPGADLVPFWTLAVANVYRKWKRSNIITIPSPNEP